MPIRNAFTLIELLVVISIIAILSSLLMAGIGGVRSAAGSVQCLNNLRQMDAGALSFGNDNRGQIPNGEWQAAIQPYLGDGSFSSGFKIGKCPTAPAKTSNGSLIVSSYGYSGVYWAHWGVGNYWQTKDGNFFGLPWWLLIGAPAKVQSNYSTARFATIAKPSEKCMLSERWLDGPATTNADNAWGVNLLNDQSTRLVHNKRSNFACADGHVQSLLVPGIKTFAEVQWSGDTMWLPLNATSSSRMK